MTSASVPAGPGTAMCWSCGASKRSDPCPICGTPKGLPAPVPLDLIGCGCIVGTGFAAQEGLIVASGPTQVSALCQGGSVVTRLRQDVELGDPTPGLDRALSPAGALLILTGSPTFQSLRGDPAEFTAEAVRMASGDILLARLLALDAIRQGMGPRLVGQLPFSATERTWLRALAEADAENWPDALAALDSLPPDRYADRLGVYIRGRDLIMQQGLSERMRTFLDYHRSDPRAVLLWSYLSQEGAPSLEQLRAAAPAIDERLGVFLTRLQDGGDLRKFVDVSPEVMAYDALTSSAGWSVDPELLRGRPRSFIDELVERGRVSPYRLAQYRQVLNDEDATYLTARLDPRQLTDDEVIALHHESEIQRRALIRGEIGLQDVTHSGVSERIGAVDRALRGSAADAIRLRGVLDPQQMVVLEAGMQAIRDKSLPADEVVSDRTLWELLEREIGADRLLGQSTYARTAAQRSFLAWVALRGARDSLYRWDWAQCRERARVVLQLSSERRLIGEALNLVAATYWRTGRDQAATAVLEKALENNPNPALQLNAVLASSGVDADKATRTLTTLMRTAPDPQMQVQAARRGLRLRAEHHEGEPLPRDFVLALREVVVEPIPLDDFTELAEVLCTQDSDWFQDRSALRVSPHVDHPRTQVLRGRAEDVLQEYPALARALRDPVGSEDPWLTARRDLLIQGSLQLLINEPDGSYASVVAYALVGENVPMHDEERLELILQSAAAISRHADVAEGRLSQDRVDEVVSAWHEVRQLESPEQDRLLQMSNKCLDEVVGHLIHFFDHGLQESTPTDDERRNAPEWLVAEKSARHKVIAQMCLDCILPLRDTVTDPGLAGAVDGTVRTCNEALEA